MKRTRRRKIDFRWAWTLAGVITAFLWLVWNLLGRDLPHEPGPPYSERVEVIGTNPLAKGMLVWTPVNGSFFGRVEKVSKSHRFPDGTVRPGVLIYRDRVAQWVPMERMGHLVIERNRLRR